jgi:hypothetical protein
MINKSVLRGATLALAITPFSAFVHAQTATPERVEFLSGGIGVGEREDLAVRGKEFNLKVVTAAERSGAYLAGVRVKAINAGGAAVFDVTMDGPWLLAKLPPGKYALEAQFEGKALATTLAIPESGQRHAYLYWPAPDPYDSERASETSPSWAAPRP